MKEEIEQLNYVLNHTVNTALQRGLHPVVIVGMLRMASRMLEDMMIKVADQQVVPVAQLDVSKLRRQDKND